MYERYKRSPDAKIQMPVRLALMIAQDEAAVDAFASLDPGRKEEYLRRARRATESGELRSVVDDIKTIG